MSYNISDYLKILLLFLMAGCGQPRNSGESGHQDVDSLPSPEVHPIPEEDSEMFPKAFATILPASGSELEGTATFSDQGDGQVTLRITVENAPPGEHAVHIHEHGDCTADDASSAGGHWAPLGNQHGKRNVDLEHHKGDLANMIVGDNGTGELTMTVLGWSVGGADSTNILSKSVVIHEGADDFVTQPSGNAGARVGCGVIIGVE